MTGRQCAELPVLAYRDELLRRVAAHPAISRSTQGRVARELLELERDLPSGTWQERRGLVAGNEYACTRARLNAAHYARRAVLLDSIAREFVDLVINSLQLGSETELDKLSVCFPLLEALNDAEHVVLLHAPVSQTSLEGMIVVQANAAILDRRGIHLLAIEIGQRCAAWSSSRKELLALMSQLWHS